jgi:uncharacterized protein
VDRPFLDANVLFSAAYKDDSALQALWKFSDIVLLTSALAVAEAVHNLTAKRPQQLSLLQQLLEAVTLVDPVAETASLPEEVTLPEKDRPILLAAIAAGATHLLTGDQTHFGPYYGRSIGGVLIVRPRDYLDTRTPPP